MGISSNQARFLALTARQVDLEQRVQQICQRRLRLASQLEQVATEYNNSIGNRMLYTYNTSNSGISNLSIWGIQALTDTNGNNYKLLGLDTGSQYQDVTYVAGSGQLTIGSGGTAVNLTAATLGITFDSTATDDEKQAILLDAAIRTGLVQVTSVADEFTQSEVGIGAATTGYELLDWRTMPELADELYRGDDVNAENKYDRTVTEINSQDKKLQLEQTSIEVEYKAITSEKEAVKKILDTNAQASFKYFS